MIFQKYVCMFLFLFWTFHNICADTYRQADTTTRVFDERKRESCGEKRKPWHTQGCHDPRSPQRPCKERAETLQRWPAEKNSKNIKCKGSGFINIQKNKRSKLYNYLTYVSSGFWRFWRGGEGAWEEENSPEWEYSAASATRNWTVKHQHKDKP